MAEAGHKFLAKLGKKRLRPGGKLGRIVENSIIERQRGRE